MAAATSLENKVRRLDNDVQAIYEMLASIQAQQGRHSNRFVEMDDRFDKVDDRFDKVDDRFDKVDERLGKVDERLDTMGSRLDEVLTILRG